MARIARGCVSCSPPPLIPGVRQPKHRTFSQWVVMNFEIISEIRQIETIAIGRAIHDLARLRRVYGTGRWRKLKGVATIRLTNGRIRVAELHWYEAHGIGRKEIKRKRYLD